MSYTKNTWVDRVATGDNRFKDQNNTVYTFTPYPNSVTTAGTPFSASWMNHIEDGIFGAWIKALLGQQQALPSNSNLNNIGVGAYQFEGNASSMTNLPSGLFATQTNFWLYVGTDRAESNLFQLLVAEEVADASHLGDVYVYMRFGYEDSPNVYYGWCTLYAPRINMTEDLDFASGWSANTSGKNYVSRQYNRCVLSISAKCTSAMSPSTANTIATITNDKLKPKYTTYGVLYGYHSSTPTIDRVTVNTNGTVQIQGTTAANTSITGMVVYDSADS